MRKIIVINFITLDGIMQAPGGSEEDTAEGFKFGGWTTPYFDDFLGEEMGRQMKPPFSLLLGRKTFEIFAGYWPKHESEWPGVNGATKYVVSKTLSKSDWENTVFIKGDIVAEIKKLKSSDGPPLHVYGSGRLIRTLMDHELIDEYWLKIFPLTLGTGKRIFQEGSAPTAFELYKSIISPRGVIVAYYRRTGIVKPN